MTDPNDNLSNVLFRFHSDVLDQETVETMWARMVDRSKGYFELDSVPFFVPDIASGDIVHAEYDSGEGMLTYRTTIAYSGHSTIQVVVMDQQQTDANQLRATFTPMGCTSEKYSEGYFVLDVPSDIDYRPLKEKLNELRDVGVIDYAESCLSDRHRNIGRDQ